MTADTRGRTSFPPFTQETATSKVRMSQDEWSRLEAERASPACPFAVPGVIPLISTPGESRFYGFPEGINRSVRVGTRIQTDRVRTRPDRSPRTLSLSLNNADSPVTPRGSAQASAGSPRVRLLSGPPQCPARTARRAQKRFRFRQVLLHESLRRCWSGSFPRPEPGGGARRACKAIRLVRRGRYRGCNYVS